MDLDVDPSSNLLSNRERDKVKEIGDEFLRKW